MPVTLEPRMDGAVKSHSILLLYGDPVLDLRSSQLTRSSEAWIDCLPLRLSGELIFYGL
jgi:hypothetical protein